MMQNTVKVCPLARTCQRYFQPSNVLVSVQLYKVPCRSSTIKRYFQDRRHLACSRIPFSARHVVSQCSGKMPDIDLNIVDVTDSVDIRGLANVLISKAAERDVMVKTIPRTLLEKHLRMLILSGFKQTEYDILVKYPAVFHNLEEFCKVVHFLQELGVGQEDWNSIFSSFPQVFSISRSELSQTTEELYSMGFKTENMKSLLIKCPQILDASLSSIEQRINELKKLFKSSDVFRLLGKTPQLLFCPLSEIEERFHYVYHVMGITQPQMMFSDTFSHSLAHIQTRHLFAVRSGYFRTSKKKEGQVDHNPKLDKLLDTSDEDFAEMFGNMTAQDFQCFQKLLHLERKKLQSLSEEEEDN